MPEISPSPVLDLLKSLNRPLKWGLIAGVITTLITIFIPNHYRSEARLLPVESKGIGGNLGGLANAAAAFGVSLPGSDGSDANFLDVLNSRWLREQVVRAHYHFCVQSWRFGSPKWEDKTLYEYLDAKNMDQAIQGVAGILTSSRDPKSKMITISAETTSPELSQQIVIQATRLLETFNIEKSRTRGGAKAIFAEARLAEGRREMEVSEESYRHFLEANRNYLTSGDPFVRLRGLRLEAEFRLRQQLVTSLAINREQAMLEEKNDIPILSVLDSGSLPIEKNWPARGQMVFSSVLFAGLVVWLLINRKWFMEQVLNR